MMSQEDPHTTGSAEAPPAPGKPDRRRLVIGLLVLVAVWAGVMVFRWELRAQWWSYQLSKATNQEDRAFYLTRLASIGNKSLRALPRLIAHDDPQTREAALSVLRYCSGEQADALLLPMLGDPEPEIAGLAATVLAMRPNAGEYVTQFRDKIALSVAPEASWGMIVALGRLPGKPAEDALLQLAAIGLSPDAKAQLIDSLGLRGCRQAIPLITAALDDHRPIKTLPFSQLSARRAIGALQSDLLAKGIHPAEALNAAGSTPTVSSLAARWLDLLAESRPAPPTTQTSQPQPS